jgi:hypothetical protein
MLNLRVEIQDLYVRLNFSIALHCTISAKMGSVFFKDTGSDIMEDSLSMSYWTSRIKL